MLKEKIKVVRYALIDMITNTFDVSINGYVDYWIEQRLTTLVNQTLEEAAQLAYDMDGAETKFIVEAIRAMKVQ